MESDKEHCLYQKKNADVHRIIYQMYGENVIFIRKCANWFKNGDFNISDKEHSGHPAAMEEGEL